MSFGSGVVASSHPQLVQTVAIGFFKDLTPHLLCFKISFNIAWNCFSAMGSRSRKEIVVVCSPESIRESLCRNKTRILESDNEITDLISAVSTYNG